MKDILFENCIVLKDITSTQKCTFIRIICGEVDFTLLPI